MQKYNSVLCARKQVHLIYFFTWHKVGALILNRDPRNLGLISLIKKRKICFRILSDLGIQYWSFFNKTRPKLTICL